MVKKLFMLIGLVLVSAAANAAVPTDNALNQIVDAYQNASSNWEPTIRDHAFNLFWLLVGIDFAWGAIKQAVDKSEFDTWAAFIIYRIMTYGFFLALIEYGSSWSYKVIQSFSAIASDAGGSPDSLSPSKVLDIGLNIAVEIINKTSGWNFGKVIVGGLLGAFILFIFALVAAELIFVLVSMWIVVYAGVIMLAFGGLSFTRDYAINYYKTVLAVAVKLFVIQLLVAIGIDIIKQWGEQMSDPPEWQEMFIIAGGILVLFSLVKGIGGLVESLINGTGAASASGSGAIMGAVGSAGAAIAGAGAVMQAGKQMGSSAIGGAQAIHQASQLAKENAAPGGGVMSRVMSNVGAATAGSPGAAVGQKIGGAFDRMGGTLGNLARAGASDANAKIKGQVGSNMGTTGGRMAESMKGQRAENAAKKDDGGNGSSMGNFIAAGNNSVNSQFSDSSNQGKSQSAPSAAKSSPSISDYLNEGQGSATINNGPSVSSMQEPIGSMAKAMDEDPYYQTPESGQRGRQNRNSNIDKPTYFSGIDTRKPE